MCTRSSPRCPLPVYQERASNKTSGRSTPSHTAGNHRCCSIDEGKELGRPISLPLGGQVNSVRQYHAFASSSRVIGRRVDHAYLARLQPCDDFSHAALCLLEG